MSRTICVVTGTRAEYGLLRYVMEGIRDADDLTLQLLVTGTHLSKEFGMTCEEIERDGLPITRKIDLELNCDKSTGIAHSMAVGVREFAVAFEELKPDIMLVLGDRFEIMAAVTAAMLARIPIAHLHGGEATQGAIDEAIRHSITKMSHVHFVAAEAYRNRVIQLGEHPDSVHLVGGLGVDGIARMKLLDRAALEEKIGFTFGKENFLVTFHPVTLEDATAATQMTELLAALDARPQAHVIFTMPNADHGSRALFALINDYVATHPNTRVYTSLGYRNYLSALALVDAAVGNSSSGLIEAPSFHIGTVNIGDRQLGRLKAASVVDCMPERGAISSALAKVMSPAFKAELPGVKNPYGEPGASAKIVQQLRVLSLENILKKKFYDVTVP